MNRAVVNVATGPHFLNGQARLIRTLCVNASLQNIVDYDSLPDGWPTHADKPFGFKAYAVRRAADIGYTSLLWCDSSILPIRSLEPVWETIERDGYLIMNNGWSNYQWTADSAYPDLFGHEIYERTKGQLSEGPVPPITVTMSELREINRTIPHIVAGCFGLNVASDIGRAILAEYYRLASETRAFCGPTTNANRADYPLSTPLLGPTVQPCGPPDVLGHRHDQTALSVIVWRLGCKLTDAPEYFSYAKNNSTDPADYDPRTCLLAHGNY